MKKEVSVPKKIWRMLLKEYYSFERKILQNHKRREEFIRLCALLPIQKNKVVIDNYIGKGFGDNAKYIAEELFRRNTSIKIVWMVNNLGYDFPKYIKPVSRYSLRALYESVTAKAWVFNTRNCRLTNKRKNQIYLQTWHGGITTKKIEKDAEEKLSKDYVEKAKEDGRLATGIIAEGAFIEGIYRQAFWLNEQCEILRFGLPRDDVLLNTKTASLIKKMVRSRLGIDCEAYVVLYAPTFRNDGSTTGYINDLESVRNAFINKHKNVVMLVRLHPNVAQMSSELQYVFSDHLINVTDYDDPQELVVASDCGITDYSTMIFEFALMQKPGFVCMKDLDSYVEERGVYELFNELPFKKNMCEDELIEEIISFDEFTYQKKLEMFYKKYPTYNKGDATEKTVNWLISKGLC